MFRFLTFGVFCLCTSLQESSASSEGYYWREYNGTVPEDAIIGDDDVNRTIIYNGNNNNQTDINGTLYIGQTYFHDNGLMVAQISPGEKEVHFHFANKPYTVDRRIEILCGTQANFYWAPTTADTMHKFIIGKHAVKGGHQEDSGDFNIGRTIIDGEMKIGRIHSYASTPDIAVDHEGSELLSRNFEILLYMGKGQLFDEERVRLPDKGQEQLPEKGGSASSLKDKETICFKNIFYVIFVYVNI